MMMFMELVDGAEILKLPPLYKLVWENKQAQQKLC